jgi:assimilatory nitrate reductase catalytic subunit
MGFVTGFDYDAPQRIFTEHAQLSGLDNAGTRGFDIGGLAGLTREAYDELQPVQWPLRAAAGPGTKRLFEDGRFYHANGKARFIATEARPAANAPDDDYPLVLNTGRIRDQWHTMTRTGLSPRLAEHLPEPFVDLHAQDALLAGVRVGELARLKTGRGSMVVRVRTSGEIARGTAFAPIHWNSANASQARVGALIDSVVDPVSGEPEFKHTPLQVEPFPVDWYGFALSRRPIESSHLAWWALIRSEHCFRYELAARRVAPQMAHWARQLLDVSDPDADYLDYQDETAGIYRAAHVVDGRLIACVYLSRRPELPSRSWLAGLFSQQQLPENARATLLAGRPSGARLDPGPLVCACFGVGRNTLTDAIGAAGLTTTQQIGSRLRAGTNCGSCLPELRALLQSSPRIPAAAR